METVTLRGEDFRTIHNTLCDLRSLMERMTHSMIKIEDVQRIIQGFEVGLSDAYDQDNAAFENKMELYSEVRQVEGLSAIWSIYEVEDLYAPHPFIAAQQIAYKDHWGEKAIFKGIDGDRWVDLYRAADAAIRESGDEHHVFIEHFITNPDCPEQLFLSTGS